MSNNSDFQYTYDRIVFLLEQFFETELVATLFDIHKRQPDIFPRLYREVLGWLHDIDSPAATSFLALAAFKAARCTNLTDASASLRTDLRYCPDHNKIKRAPISGPHIDCLRRVHGGFSKWCLANPRAEACRIYDL